MRERLGQGSAANSLLPVCASVSRTVGQAPEDNGTTKGLCQAYSMTSFPTDTESRCHWVVFQLEDWDGPQCVLSWMGQDTGLVSSLTGQSYAYLVILWHLIYTVGDTNS